jgi:hypothetical protein
MNWPLPGADDKEREARNGYDGTWVAHPDLVPWPWRCSTH